MLSFLQRAIMYCLFFVTIVGAMYLYAIDGDIVQESGPYAIDLVVDFG
ncbi:MAG: hypothetical protein AB7F19_07400 [Candidatus Babeliales bacterium]